MGASLVVPGGGHFYTGRTRRALMLVLTYAVALGTMIFGAVHARPVGLAGAALFLSVIVFDQIGAQREISRTTRRARR